MRPKPKLERFETLEAYLEALIEWKLEQRLELDREWLRRLKSGTSSPVIPGRCTDCPPLDAEAPSPGAWTGLNRSTIDHRNTLRSSPSSPAETQNSRDIGQIPGPSGRIGLDHGVLWQ
jgi:hypothetical protein